MAKGLKRQPALALPELTREEIISIKCLYLGTANDIQQKLAISTVMKKFCMMGGLEFDVDERVSAFNGGKRLVGLQLLHIIDTPYDKLVTSKGDTK